MSDVMIDWITGFIESDPVEDRKHLPFDTGRFQKITPEGEITEDYSSRISHVGSFESALSFRAPYPYQLEMSGNPAKFLQGHNLFGLDKPLDLFLGAGLAVSSPNPKPRGAGIFPNPQEFIEGAFQRPRFTRLDLTRSYRFSAAEEARSWLRTVGASAHSRHRNSTLKDGTVYMGPNSSRWAFKMYHKADELVSTQKGHALSLALSDVQRSELLEWSQGVVRFELTLRSPELKKIFLNFDASEIWQMYYSKILFNNNNEVRLMKDFSDAIDSLPNHLKTAVRLWRSGEDMRTIYSKNQFYRNRRALLEATGLDISEPPATEVDALLTVASDLSPEQWDPEPIQEMLYRSEPSVLESYGF